MRKMRRTEVACVECRRRKLKCEGTRPSCSRCQTYHLECSYRPTTSAGRAAGMARGDLLKRIENLEESLRAVTSVQQMQASNLTLTPTPTGEQCEDREREMADEGVPVDELSTQALTEATDGEVGYFGPSSNYAMFRFISNLFTQTAIRFPPVHGTTQAANLHPCSDCERRRHTQNHTRPTEAIKASRPVYYLPPLNEAMPLFDRYFSTIGVVLPYIEKETMVRVYHTAAQLEPSKRRRTPLALLNIVWAHAESSLGSPQRETFYKRAVALIDSSRDVERPGYELVQTLLLVVEYKQNHQRSISSYTAHALCVKAAFHVGLHSRAARAAARSAEERALRLRLWNGVLKNDRIMNITQGRPCMVPCSRPVDYVELLHQSDVSVSDIYLGMMGSSHAIIDQALESLYDENIEIADKPLSQTLLAKWTKISWEIDAFCDGLSTVGGHIPGSEVSNHLATTAATIDGQALAVRILISIHCNRLRLLANFPLLSHALSLSTEKLGGREKEPSQRVDRLRHHRLSEILHEDWEAAREICSVISALSTYRQEFIDEFGAWYTCNYTSKQHTAPCLLPIRIP
ncbi:hypothetical protein BJX63DRAFT_387014 [Aspergillus granulosus]|uniref:Zn(2)-C6 fungal-type domain-containing protein n=1 Tax=Aspergillus granulosus TaxID=176169 RepID=A0ABR4HMQ0_9EURO